MPLSVALVFIQIVEPDGAAMPDASTAESGAVTTPGDPLPQWPRAQLAQAQSDQAQSEQTSQPQEQASPSPTVGNPVSSTTPSVRPTGSAEASAPGATPATPPVTTVSVEAEASSNLLGGDAKVASCATCDGGARVQYVNDENYLEVYVDLPVPGTRSVAVRYESDGLRKMGVQINGGPTLTYPVAGSGGWETPATFTFEAHLSAGRNALRFSGHSPDIDRIVVG
ncbi:hypothetical protein [Micromonospora sp. Llam0]|uniref:hypothetical protein n=1 Tax=Micromonospora sp. Llam0 TaxID=2485143 RepID=UPI0011CE85E7|nr:hypothetical protein [Micromonospora sp. Llam0]